MTPKTGPRIGQFGCLLWVMNYAISPKAQWIALTLGITAILMVVTATIITAAQKGRLRLGIWLSPLSILFGLGFLIVLLVPGKTPASATPLSLRI